MTKDADGRSHSISFESHSLKRNCYSNPTLLSLSGSNYPKNGINNHGLIDGKEDETGPT